MKNKFLLILIPPESGYKNEIKKHLEERGIEVKDFGITELHSVDYPNIALTVARAVASGECEKGILVCGTGIGMSIAANKVKGIRAAVCSDHFSAKYTRLHNDANILLPMSSFVGVLHIGKARNIYPETFLRGTLKGLHRAVRCIIFRLIR